VNKEGLGALITVTKDLTKPEEILVHEVNGGNNFLAQNEKIAHFGLSAATTVDQITVKWPGGQIQTLSNVIADQQLTVTQPVVAAGGDSDGDGLLDSWEMAEFGNLTAIAEADPDEDGFNNLSEEIAGTDPQDWSDQIKLQGLREDSGNVILDFPVKAGRRYRVERALLPNISQWEAVTLLSVSTDGMESFQEVIGDMGAFYRLAVEKN